MSSQLHLWLYYHYNNWSHHHSFFIMIMLIMLKTVVTQMVASAPPPKLFTQTLCWGLETEKNQIQFCLGVVRFSRELILLIAVSI